MHWMSILGLCLIIAGTAFSTIGTYINSSNSQRELTDKIDDKNMEIGAIKKSNDQLIIQNTSLLSSSTEVTNANKELLIQNKEMLDKIGVYQKDLEQKDKRIKELEYASKKTSRGIISMTQFDGTYLVRHGSSTSVSAGTEENKLYLRLIELEKKNNFPEIIKLCDESINKRSDWYTPYLFKAIALINIDISNKDEALNILEIIENNTLGDPQYGMRILNIYMKLGEETKAERIQKTLPKEIIEHIINQTQNIRNIENNSIKQ